MSTSTTSTSTSITSSTSSPTPTSTPSSKSTPVGGIVAGAVVGGIAVVAILVFGWYKIRTHRPAQNSLAQNSPQDVVQQYSGMEAQEVYPVKKSINADHQLDSMPPEGWNTTGDERGETPISTNLHGSY
jgi:hypothetical protein